MYWYTGTLRGTPVHWCVQLAALTYCTASSSHSAHAYPNNLAATLSKIGDFAGAKRACEKALDLDDKYVKAWAVGAVGREAEAPLLAGTSRRGRRRATSSSS